jgi:hypothetical protein
MLMIRCPQGEHQSSPSPRLRGEGRGEGPFFELGQQRLENTVQIFYDIVVPDAHHAITKSAKCTITVSVFGIVRVLAAPQQSRTLIALLILSPQRLGPSGLPLTPSLSPQAGRGSGHSGCFRATPNASVSPCDKTTLSDSQARFTHLA